MANKKKMFTEWICVRNNSALTCFEVGKIYPSIGNNNGQHIIGLKKSGDPQDVCLCSYIDGSCGDWNGGNEVSFFPVRKPSILLRFAWWLLPKQWQDLEWIKAQVRLKEKGEKK